MKPSIYKYLKTNINNYSTKQIVYQEVNEASWFKSIHCFPLR